jgi:hypothetical protein
MGKAGNAGSLKLVLAIVELVVEIPVIVIFTPDGFTIGVAGLILKLIDPLESVQVAGEGTGVITTVAQVPVPPPVQSGSAGDNTFMEMAARVPAHPPTLLRTVRFAL